MISYKQLSLADLFTECQTIFQEDQPAFLQLLEETIDWEQIIPLSFSSQFYASTGRPRTYQLSSMIKLLLLQRIFSVPTDSLLLLMVRYSPHLKRFCGFVKVPDASVITRFKQTFLADLQSLFDRLVDWTEPICQRIDPQKAAMAIFDTSGVEAYVTENNPKFVNGHIQSLKRLKKTKHLSDAFDPYQAAYASLPPHAASQPAIQQMYINGHFCYSYKFGILCNGLGIVRDLSFFDSTFLRSHPQIRVEKKSDSPDEDKSLADSKALLPVLTDFFQKHPLIRPNTFLGDAAFDSVSIYQGLLQDLEFEKALIPLRSKGALPQADCPLNEDGIPCCPHDSSLPMRREGSRSHLRCGLPTMKFVCPKMKWIHFNGTSKRRTSCLTPCTPSPCGRMVYVYPQKDLRLWPGTERGTQSWKQTYKIRTVVERLIGHLKNTGCVTGRRTRDSKTLHADLLLAGITQLLTVLIADKLHSHQYLRSLKSLVA